MRWTATRPGAKADSWKMQKDSNPHSGGGHAHRSAAFRFRDSSTAASRRRPSKSLTNFKAGKIKSVTTHLCCIA